MCAPPLWYAALFKPRFYAQNRFDRGADKLQKILDQKEREIADLSANNATLMREKQERWDDLAEKTAQIAALLFDSDGKNEQLALTKDLLDRQSAELALVNAELADLDWSVRRLTLRAVLAALAVLASLQWMG